MSSWPTIARWIEHEFGPIGEVAVYEPRQRSRSGLAALVFDRVGHAVAFVKIRSGRDEGLERERLALKLLAEAPPGPVRVPRVLFAGTAEDETFLVTTPRSDGFDHVARDPDLLAIQRWINSALADLPRSIDIPEHWEPGHNDLTPWNLRTCRSELWLTDWEMAGWAPPGSDATCYSLNCLAISRKAPRFAVLPEAANYWREIWRHRQIIAQTTGDADVKLSEALLDAVERVQPAGP